MSNTRIPCPIWGPEYGATEIEDECLVVEGGPNPATETVRVDSDRAGGKYEISSEGQSLARELGSREKGRLSSWLVEKRIQGISIPRVTEETVRYTSNRRPLVVQERAERLLRYIAKQADLVGVTLRFGESSDLAALAWTESTEWREVDYFFEFLKDSGWLNGDGFLNGGFIATVTVAGHAQIAQQVTNYDSSQAFVAMWFDESMTRAYTDGIRPAIEATGYKPVRIDQKEHINKIDDEIIAEIRRSRFLVADFTQGCDGARGGVYYEAGFAHALGMPVIFTCHQKSMEYLHFDTEHYNHIVWTDENELHKRLKSRILAAIGEGPETSIQP